MKDRTFFMRNGIHCLLAKDERSDDWMCFVGFDKDHPLHSVGFHRTQSAALYRYRAVNLGVDNKVWKRLNWLGCSEHPYSENKTTDLIKQIADEIADVKDEDPPAGSDEDDSFNAMMQNIIDMVDLGLP